MRFLKTDNIYKVIRMGGCQNNILGITFCEKNSDDLIEVIEWCYNQQGKILTSKDEVLSQVLTSLNSVNQSLGTNYKLSKIYFSPFDLPNNKIYQALTSVLINHYHRGKEFEEVK